MLILMCLPAPGLRQVRT